MIVVDQTSTGGNHPKQVYRFQDHLVLETLLHFRIILGLEYAEAKRRTGRRGPNDLTWRGCRAAGCMATIGAVCLSSRGIPAESSSRLRRTAKVRSMRPTSARSDRVPKVVAVPRAPARPVRPTR